MRLEDKVRNRLEIHHPTSWRCEANASLAIAFPRPTYTFERVKGVLLEEERGGAQAGREARLNPYTPHHQVRTGMHSCQCLVLVPLSFTERERARARSHLFLCTPLVFVYTKGHVQHNRAPFEAKRSGARLSPTPQPLLSRCPRLRDNRTGPRVRAARLL